MTKSINSNSKPKKITPKQQRLNDLAEIGEAFKCLAFPLDHLFRVVEKKTAGEFVVYFLFARKNNMLRYSKRLSGGHTWYWKFFGENNKYVSIPAIHVKKINIKKTLEFTEEFRTILKNSIPDIKSCHFKRRTRSFSGFGFVGKKYTGTLAAEQEEFEKKFYKLRDQISELKKQIAELEQEQEDLCQSMTKEYPLVVSQQIQDHIDLENQEIVAETKNYLATTPPNNISGWDYPGKYCNPTL